MLTIDYLIIGTPIALELKRRYPEAKKPELGRHSSARNSGVAQRQLLSVWNTQGRSVYARRDGDEGISSVT